MILAGINRHYIGWSLGILVNPFFELFVYFFFFFPLDGRQYVSLMRFICWESFLSLSVFGSESVLHSLCSLFTNTDELKSTPTLLFSFFLTYHNTRLTLRWPLTYIVIYFFQACDWLWALVFWEVYIFLKFFWRWKR